MHNELRLIDLAAATGNSRTEMMNGVEYLVVPVVALVEGVIHPVNAKTPEFVSGKVLQQAAHTWNGRPCVLNHPDIDGVKVSANSPRILEKYAFGTIFDSVVDGSMRMTQEAWIDPVRLEALDKQLLADLRADKKIGVSVGAHVAAKAIKGKHKDKAYQSEWLMALGDHLAFLPQSIGACSIEMGCGTHMTAAEGTSMTVTDRLRGMIDQLRAALSTTESDQDQRRAILIELKKQEPDVWDITALYKNRIVYPVWGPDGNVRYFERPFTGNAKDGYTLDGTRTEVKQAPVKFVPAEAAPDADEIEDDPTPAAVVAAIHNDGGDDAAHQEEDQMNKEQKTAVITALIACPCSGFTAADVKMLEAASDERLEAFRVAADKKKTDDAAAAAALKAAQDATAAAQSQITALEAQALKPEELTSLRALKAEKDSRDAARKTELVTKLETAAKSAFSKDELNAMELPALEKLATLTAVEVPPVDFSARGVAQPRLVGAQKRDFTPPDPWAKPTDKTAH